MRYVVIFFCTVACPSRLIGDVEKKKLTEHDLTLMSDDLKYLMKILILYRFIWDNGFLYSTFPVARPSHSTAPMPRGAHPSSLGLSLASRGVATNFRLGGGRNLTGREGFR